MLFSFSFLNSEASRYVIAIYGPMIYTYVIFLMRIKGWAQKRRDFHGISLRMAWVMDFPKSKTIHTGPYQSEVHK